jgi:hypothetical protein
MNSALVSLCLEQVIIGWQWLIRKLAQPLRTFVWLGGMSVAPLVTEHMSSQSDRISKQNCRTPP